MILVLENLNIRRVIRTLSPFIFERKMYFHIIVVPLKFSRFVNLCIKLYLRRRTLQIEIKYSKIHPSKLFYSLEWLKIFASHLSLENNPHVILRRHNYGKQDNNFLRIFENLLWLEKCQFHVSSFTLCTYPSRLSIRVEVLARCIRSSCAVECVPRAGIVSIPRRAKIIHCQWYAYSTCVNIHKSPRCVAPVFDQYWWAHCSSSTGRISRSRQLKT